MIAADAKSSTLTNQDLDKLRTAISAGPVRPFLVTLDRSSCSGTNLNIHIAREAVDHAVNTSPRLMRRDISRQISALGLDVSVRVKFYSRRALDKSRSLQQFIVKFERGERLYDPAGVFDEAECLVNFAYELRRQLGGELKGIYWSSRWRTTYVVLNEEAFVDGYCMPRGKLAAAELSVIDAYQASAAHRGTDRADQLPDVSSDRFEAAASQNVRLCFDVPAVPLVPIDEASIPHERARRLSIPKLPRLLQFSTLSKVPLLAAFFSLGSAGMAIAKLPTFETKPMLTGADTTIAAPDVSARDITKSVDNPRDAAALLSSGESDLFPGGPGLHLLWRDPIHGAVGRNPSSEQTPRGTQHSEPQTTSLAGRDEAIGRDHFREVSKSGATFSGRAATAHKGKLDLKWVADDERIRGSGPDGSIGRPSPSASPVMQSGVAAVLGLCNLMRSNSSDEAFAIALEDLRSHFGLPRSLQVEARWHFDDTAHSSTPLHRIGEVFHRKVLIAPSESYWEWLRRMGPSNPTAGWGDYKYRRDFDNVQEAQRKKKTRPRGSSA